MSSPLTPPINSSPHLSSDLTPSKDLTRISSISLNPSNSFPNSLPKPNHNPSNKDPIRPADSWETAYVFAFIIKFTSLCQDLDTGLRLRSVLDLERALEADTSSTDESAPDAGPGTSEAKQILTDIITTFHENLKLNNPHPWTRWLKSYMDEIVQSELRWAGGSSSSSVSKVGSLKWKENWIRTRKNGFWDLDWAEKVHLLRILVDRQLTYSPKIRQIIDSNYEKALASKPANKSTSTTTTTTSNLNSSNNHNKTSTVPSIGDHQKLGQQENPLLIKPLGLDRNVKTWWQIDDSPRMYSSGNPYKSNCTWAVLSSTRSDFHALQSTLAADPSLSESAPPSEAQAGGRRLKIPAMFTAAARKKAGAGGGKKVETGIRWEWQLSQALVEIAEPRIVAGEQRVARLVEARDRQVEAEARKQRRLLAVAPRPAGLTRATPGFAVSSRLRSQVTRPDYVVDSSDVDRLFERTLRAHDRAVPAKRTRRRGGGGSETSEAEEEEEAGSGSDGDFAPETDTAGRPSRKRQREQRVQPAQSRGERRSSRVRTSSNKADPSGAEEVGDGKAGGAAEEERVQVAWSRAEPASVTSESVGEGGSFLVDCEGNGAAGGSGRPGGEGSVGPGAGTGGTADGAELNGNVSVWSRGKLVYVTGNNKYATKQVAAGPVMKKKKKIIAKPGAGVILETQEPSRIGIESLENNPSSGIGGCATRGGSSLAGLKARLASMGGGDDDDDDEEEEQGLEGEERVQIVGEVKKVDQSSSEQDHGGGQESDGTGDQIVQSERAGAARAEQVEKESSIL